MAKPQAIEIKSDDCVVTIDGEKYALHEGESVWLIPGLSVGTIRAMNTLMAVGPRMDAAKGEPDELATITRLADESFQAVCEALAQRVQRWTWTDLLGNALPQPGGAVESFQSLTPEELFWLLSAAKGETAGARKNA